MENGLPMQINTNKRNIEDVRERLATCKSSNDLDSLFLAAYVDIYSMLSNIYVDFEKNDFFNQMTADLTIGDQEKSRDTITLDSGSSNSGYGSIYPMKAYYLALDTITYTVGSIERIFDELITSKHVSISRHRLICRMIVTFCELRLKMDFPETSMNLRQTLLTSSTTALSTANQRASIISNLSAITNISQSNSSTGSIVGRRKDELDFF